MLTTEQVAAEFQVSEETVRRWLRSGALRGIRLGERRTGWRIPQSAIDELLRRREAATGETTAT